MYGIGVDWVDLMHVLVRLEVQIYMARADLAQVVHAVPCWLRVSMRFRSRELVPQDV